MSYSIGVIGTGYVGLVTGTCLADIGNQVVCIDVDANKLERLRSGDPVIFERGLEHILVRNIREGRLEFSLDLADAVRRCSILMFCLPTPPDKDGAADLAAVISVSKHVAQLLVDLDIQEPRIVANKSTVPVGTAARVEAIFRDVAPDKEVFVVSNPEFLREGFAVDDFMKPDRVIVGSSSAWALEVMADLYTPFVKWGAPIYKFDVASAEVAKYAANSFLATKISFMNDLSEYCEAVGADIENVRMAIGADERIGRRFLFSGIGYGGSCFPKDVQAIIHAARSAGTPLEIVEATHVVNRQQMERFTARIIRRFEGNVHGKRFALWGLSFKPNTDDVRDAPAFEVANILVEQGAQISAYDPEAINNARRVLGDRIMYAESMYAALDDADALIIATEWNEFRNPDFGRVRSSLRRALIFDGRNLYNLDEMGASGFEYHSIGRATVLPGDEDEADY